MTIPAPTHEAWKKIVTGELELKSSNLVVNMLIHNSRVKYKDEPTPAKLTALAKRVHDVFAKHGVAFSAELHQIFGQG